MSTAVRVALLAPVPLEHLESGQTVCAKEGKVAFGSRAWEVFRKLDDLRKGLPVDVFIYASDAGQMPQHEISWQGRYVGHVESDGGAHPDGMRYRPQSTTKYQADNNGFWAVFWEVEDLREVSPDMRKQIEDLQGLDKPAHFKGTFVPEGPILIEHPV